MNGAAGVCCILFLWGEMNGALYKWGEMNGALYITRFLCTSSLLHHPRTDLLPREV